MVIHTTVSVHSSALRRFKRQLHDAHKTEATETTENLWINPLNTKRRLLYLKTQFVPRSKHFSSRL